MGNVNLLEQVISLGIPLVFAITLHEFAHEYVAYLYGDLTAKTKGRLTLNPIYHINTIGTIMIPAMLFFISKGAFIFGYAKPVPINFSNLNNPKVQIIWIAFAGPASNLIQAICWAVCFLFFEIKIFALEHTLLIQMCKYGVIINVILFVLNLFPLPPLDGAKVFSGILPNFAAKIIAKIEPFGLFILILLLISEILSKLWISPSTNLTLLLIDLLIYPIRFLLQIN